MSKQPSITIKVRQIIKEQLDVDDKDLRPEALLIDDLGADSLNLLELVLAAEDMFEIDISDNDENARKIQTVQDAINYVESRVK